MKKFIALLILTLFYAGIAQAADDSSLTRRDLALLDSTMVVGTEECHHLSLDFTNIDAQTIIAGYAKFSGVELITDSHAKVIRTPISVQAYELTQSQQISLVERALKEQAGIVITRLDDKRAAVTYDRALPIKKPKD
jgi:hypothetical protein